MESRDWAGAQKLSITVNRSRTSWRPLARLRVDAILGAVAAVFAAASVGAANQIVSIRHHEGPDATRVVVSTTDVASFKVFRLDNPHRVVIDLFDTRPAMSFSVPAVDGRIVEGVRTSPRRRVNYRVVLDLRQRVDHREHVLAPDGSRVHRLVIDLYPVDGEQDLATGVVPPARDRDIIVAVDSGHGGNDPGAVGAGRVYEKTIVLAIARQLKRELDALPGFRTVMTRDGDYYLDLRPRFQIADRAGADMFVSIHANAFRKSSINGAEVYVLSSRGASRETAKLLADREGGAEGAGGFGPVSLHDVDESVARIMVDLSMDSKRNKSVLLGEAVLGALAGTVKLRKEHLYEKAFQVLRSASLPSILVEVGYLSNPGDLRLLTNPAHQKRLARAIANGIRNYAYMNAPDGTLVASMNEAGALRYVVKRGDTLSEIASRYRTSTRLLRLRNNLRSSDRILVGQVLSIPFGKASG